MKEEENAILRFIDENTIDLAIFPSHLLYAPKYSSLKF